MPIPTGQGRPFSGQATTSVPGSTFQSVHFAPGVLSIGAGGYAGGSIISPVQSIPNPDLGFIYWASITEFGESFGANPPQYIHEITIQIPSGSGGFNFFSASTGLCDSGSATFNFSFETVYISDTQETALGGCVIFDSVGSVGNFTENLATSGAWSIGVVAGSASANNSGTFTSANVESTSFNNQADYGANLWAFCGGGADGTGPVFSSASSTLTVMGATIGVPQNGSWIYPPPGAGNVFANFSGGVEVTNTINNGPQVEEGNFAIYGASLGMQIPTNYQISGQTYQLDTLPYPGTLNYWAQMLGNELEAPLAEYEFFGSPNGIPQFAWQAAAQIVSFGGLGGTLGNYPSVLQYIYSQPNYLSGLSVYIDNASLAATSGVPNVIPGASVKGSAASASTLTISVPVSGNLLVVGLAWDDQSVSVLSSTTTGVIYGGEECVQASLAEHAPGGSGVVQQWYLPNPTTGTANLVITMTGPCNLAATAVPMSNYGGTFGTSPANSGVSTAATLTAPRNPGDVFIDMLYVKGQTPSPTGSGQVLDQVGAVGPVDFATSNSRPGSSNTLSYSFPSTDWAQVGLVVQAASGLPDRTYFMEMAVAPYDAISISVSNDAVWDNLTVPQRWYRGYGSGSPAGYPNTENFPSAGSMQFDTSKDSANNPIPTGNYWVSAIYPNPLTNPTYDVLTPLVSGFRYLYFELTAVNNANVPFTLQITDQTPCPSTTSIPDKFWNLETGAANTPTPFLIDMCCPGSGGVSNPSKIQQDSLLPLVWSYNEWGVNQINTLRLNFPNLVSDQYQITNLQLRYTEAPRWSWLTEAGEVIDGNLPMGYLWPETPFRLLTIDTDGRRAEVQSYPPLNTVPGFDDEYSTTLTQLALALNALTGYSATVLATSPTWNNSELACDVGGNGGINPPSGQSWIENQTVSATIQGQVRVQTLFCPPQCGDILGAGGGSGNVPVKVNTRLRGDFTGITLNSSGQPVAGANVTVTQGTLARGTATSDSEGRYVTGPIYPTGDCTVSDGTFSLPMTTGDRLIRRCCPEPTPVSGFSWHLQDLNGRLHIATVINGDVLYSRSDTPTLPYAVQNVVTSLGDVIFASMIIHPLTGYIYMIVTRKNVSSGAYTLEDFYSWTDGSDFLQGSFSEANALFGIPWNDSSGGMGYSYFVYNSGTSGPGTGWTVYTPVIGQAFGAPYQMMQMGGGSPVAIASEQGWSNVQQSVANNGMLSWTPTLSGNTIPTPLFSTDQGQTWNPTL